MTETANLGLPFIDGSQAQKHVTHNEALRILDDAIQIAVLDSALTTPPSSPADGERYIVASGATGTWAGQGDTVATWETNAWRFLAPKAGWCVWSIADAALLVFDGTAWMPVTAAATSLDNVPSMGINTEVAESNLLTVRSNDALLNAIETADGGTGDVRLQLSKSEEGNTSSVVFSDAFSGRAEFGLTGDDDFHLKVSADGTLWRDALKFDRTTGRVSFPSGGARELLTANRTYYVDATNGNDSNDGLASGSGRAFKTIQKSYSAICMLDLGGFTVTVQLADGTYTTGLKVSVSPVGGNVAYIGNTATPGNVIISTTSSAAISVTSPINLALSGLKLQTTTSGDGISAAGAGSNITLGAGMQFGACAGAQINANRNSLVSITSAYTINGGAQYHVRAQQGGLVSGGSIACTLTGTPAFSAATFSIESTGVFTMFNWTFSGSATGKRYDVSGSGGLNSFGGGTASTFFPGNSNGTMSTNGWQS